MGTWGRHSTSFDAIRMSFGHSTVIPNANLDCFFLPFLVNRRGRYASKRRRFSFQGNSTGDPSFHKTKLHPNDGHFHLVVNPSPIQGKGLYVHLVHKSMILQSGPFLVLEPQKYTCLPVLGMKNHNFLQTKISTNLRALFVNIIVTFWAFFG